VSGEKGRHPPLGHGRYLRVPIRKFCQKTPTSSNLQFHQFHPPPPVPKG